MGGQLSDQEWQQQIMANFFDMAIFNDHDMIQLVRDIANPPESGFDEERHLFEYNPLDASDPSATSYQRLLTVTDMMLKLLGAWKKRSRIGQQVNDVEDLDLEDLDLEDLDPNFDINLYQMGQEDRIVLRSYSVLKILEIFEGESEIEKLTEKVNQAVTFLKKTLGLLLGRCLPMALPFPVMSTILSHLISEEGLLKVGLVGEEEKNESESEARVLPLELRDMMNMYDNIAHLYSLIRDVMFSFYRGVRVSTEELRQRKEELIKSVDDMMEALGDKLDSDGPVE